MSVLIGVVLALLVVALVVALVLRLQRSRNNGRRHRHKNAAVAAGGLGLEHRGSADGPPLTDKAGGGCGGSPISKHESSGGECDSDEKNPDVIPQPIEGDDASSCEGTRRRQHVSTIETSPSRSLLHQPAGYMGYCTLRNGMPLHELSTQPKLLPGGPQLVGPYSTCTLPRQPPPQWQYGPMSHLPPGIYPVPYRGPLSQQRIRTQPREPPIAMQPLANADEEPSVETPLMANKRESTV